MNKRLKKAIERCAPVQAGSLEDFLEPLLDKTPDQLARTPGTPATVLAAQFLYYAKTAALLREDLRRNRTSSARIENLIARMVSRKFAAAAAPLNVLQEVTRHDPPLPARKGCPACPAACPAQPARG